MKHTPGPWKVNFRTLVQAGNEPIADCGTDCEQEQCLECESNARLIAAAPDLLEALKILLVQFGEYKDGDGAAKYHAINIAKDAINKAERK